MKKSKLFTIICMCLLLVFVYGCKKGSMEGETGEASTREHGEEGSHEHAEGAEHEHGEEGEEAGPQISIDGIHDEVRKGVRLIISFDSESSSFIGTVENIIKETASKVRVEVHLSNGKELGPTKPVDLEPGKKIEIKLSTEGHSFTWWKAHAEVGASEH